VARLLAAVGIVTVVATGCASTGVQFPNATPGAPRMIPAVELRPEGAGPFPAVVLLHGCHGVSASTRAWGAWFRERGYVALIVNSWAPRGFTRDLCTPRLPEVPNTERFDDGVGAFGYLQSRPYVDPTRIGVIGWSQGGVFAMALVNGPSHERARRRGVVVPPPGFRAAVAFYPGGCSSLVAERVERPLLVLMGEADDWTVPGPCVEMVERMRERGADARIVLYPGAYHHFDVEGQPRVRLTDVVNRNLPGECCGATVAGDPAAAADARRRVEEFFGYHLGAR
jgi:dienelactone hydrolase